MKILTISDVYFPRINGVSTSIKTFYDVFRAEGHELQLIAPRYGDEKEDSEILRIPSWGVPFDPEDRTMKPGQIYRHIPHFRQRGFDLVHIQTPFIAHIAGLKLARQLDLPTVTTYHTFFEEYLFHYVPFAPAGMMRGLARRYSRTQCNEVDVVVVPSLAMEERLRRYGVTTRMERIPTGLELDHFSQGDGARFRERHGIAPERPTLTHISRVAFEKNIDFILRVLDRVRAEIPDVLLVIAGEGPALNSLKKTVQNLGLDQHVLFVGYLSRDDALLDCYRAADAFVFASRTETQGLVILEAMASGLPVVSTAVMGTREILEAGKGALVADDDIEDFRAKVVTILRDRELRQRLAVEAREYANEWSNVTMAKRMLDLYREIADRRNAARPNATRRSVG
ncbi:MAG: glycosyltransferase [Acidobacteriota bacterium]